MGLIDEFTKEPCLECDDPGSGMWGGNGKCNKCHGRGDDRSVMDAVEDFITFDDEDSDCPRCGGDGDCPRCEGEGWIYDD